MKNAHWPESGCSSTDSSSGDLQNATTIALAMEGLWGMGGQHGINGLDSLRPVTSTDRHGRG
jgi:hypothetical protein